jgi:hypothetical protein
METTIPDSSPISDTISEAVEPQQNVVMPGHASNVTTSIESELQRLTERILSENVIGSTSTPVEGIQIPSDSTQGLIDLPTIVNAEVNQTDADFLTAGDAVVRTNTVYESSSTPVDDTQLAEDRIFEDPQTSLDPIMEVEEIPRLSSLVRNHPMEQIIGPLNVGVQTRRQSDNANLCLFASFISQIEPKNDEVALKDNNWIEAMQEELLQFKLQQVWDLVVLPSGKHPIRTRWVF